MTDCPRIIWMYWHQGLDQAPATARACVETWRRLNPGWKLICLDQHSVGQYIGTDQPWQALPWLGLAHRADLIRLHLLSEHGGVWADASLCCVQPLDQWIDAAVSSGFFCFAAPGRDRVMSNWFMAALPGNLLVRRQLAELSDYFCDNDFGAPGPLRQRLIRRLGKRFNRNVATTRGWFSWWVRRGLRVYPYFIFHYVFARLVEDDAECRAIWQAMPKISADGPHAAQSAGLLKPLPTTLRTAIDAREQPMYKLDWRVDIAAAPAGSVLDYLLNLSAAAGDEEPSVSEKQLVLHVGLPKTATTALQFWCDQQREGLAARGVNYPVCDSGLDVPKHQFAVGECLKGQFARTEAVMRENQLPILVLSSEGLSNHFYDFPAESLARFRELAASLGYRVTVFLVFRDPAVWLRSYYKQAVLNISNPKYEWGTSRSYDEFIQLPRVKRLTDAEALCRDMASGFGGDVQLARYEEDWFAALVSRLGVADAGLGLPPRVHGSVDDGLVELVRQVNAMNLGKLRDSVLAACQSCFNTPHVDLAHYRLKSGFAPDILQALQPKDEAQQVLKQQLLDWHAANMRKSLLGLGGWKLKQA